MSQQGIEIIGWVGAVITSICFLPQFIKVITSKTTKDLSLLMTVAILIANGVWITFGVLNNSPQVWATNVCQVVLMVPILSFKVYNIVTKKEEFKWSIRFKKKNKDTIPPASN